MMSFGHWFEERLSPVWGKDSTGEEQGPASSPDCKTFHLVSRTRALQVTELSLLAGQLGKCLQLSGVQPLPQPRLHTPHTDLSSRANICAIALHARGCFYTLWRAAKALSLDLGGLHGHLLPPPPPEVLFWA